MKNKIHVFFAFFLLGSFNFNIYAMPPKDNGKGKGKASDEQIKAWELEEEAAKQKAEQITSDYIYADKLQESEVKFSQCDDTPHSDTPCCDALCDNTTPCFVANIPAYVPSDSEGDDSDSEVDIKYKFSEDEFSNPPFKIDHEKRGYVSPKIVIKYKKAQGSHAASGIVDALSKKIFHEGFSSAGHDIQDQQKHLSVVIGLNRPRSLSSRKNGILHRELEKTVDPSLSVGWFAMFWDFSWERTAKVAHRSLVNPPPFEEIQSYYRQLKKKDPTKARTFRRENENSPNHSRSRMVPYRRIREVIKNHEITKEFIKRFRQSNPKSNLYMFFCDSDTVLFNSCFSTYTQVDSVHGDKIGAMTTGYSFDDDKNQDDMIKFASELDMRVREATARHIPLGVYYPEPALCIRVPTTDASVTESFEEKPDDRSDYVSPQESPIILKQVSKRNSVFIFVYQNALVTKTPKRATTSKAKTKIGTKNILQFSAKLNKTTGTFEQWSMQDLVNITESSAQSHACPRSWAINVLNAFELAKKSDGTKKITFDDGVIIEIKNSIGNVVRDIAISLLSRLFKSYDPISLSGKDKLTLINILKNYDQLIISDVIPKQESASRSREKELWAKIDSITSRKVLLSILAQLLNAGLADSAARDVGRIIKDVLIAKLYF